MSFAYSALCLTVNVCVDTQQQLSSADTPPAGTSILALSLRSFEALDDDGLLSMAQHAAGSGFLLTQILAQEHLRQRLLRQSKGRWHQHAVGAWLSRSAICKIYHVQDHLDLLLRPTARCCRFLQILCKQANA